MKNIFINALKDQPFVIADIGAAGGLNDRWSDLGSSITPILFEPEKKDFLLQYAGWKKVSLMRICVLWKKDIRSGLFELIAML